MKRILIPALVAGLSLGQAAIAETCLEMSDIAKKEGPFPEGPYMLSGGAGVTLKLSSFWSTSTPPKEVKGVATIKENDCFGGPFSAQLNNISLAVHLDRATTNTTEVSVNFCDHGGHENISAREASPADFIDDMPRVVGKELPDRNANPVRMNVRWGKPIVNSGGVQVATVGKLVFTGEGPLDTVVVGGQELFIHSICLSD